jgi:hypothetical protein
VRRRYEGSSLNIADCRERKQPLRAELPETGDARLSEILEPLYAVTPEQYRGAFEQVMQREKTLRVQRIQETREYEILVAFDALVDAWTENGSIILSQAVADEYNERHPSNKKQISASSIGKVLGRFRFKACRDEAHRGGRGYRFDRALLGRLKIEYGFPPAAPATPATLGDVLTSSPSKPTNIALSTTGAIGASGADAPIPNVYTGQEIENPR